MAACLLPPPVSLCRNRAAETNDDGARLSGHLHEKEAMLTRAYSCAERKELGTEISGMPRASSQAALGEKARPRDK